jgi:hypothetical protein
MGGIMTNTEKILNLIEEHLNSIHREAYMLVIVPPYTLHSYKKYTGMDYENIFIIGMDAKWSVWRAAGLQFQSVVVDGDIGGIYHDLPHTPEGYRESENQSEGSFGQMLCYAMSRLRPRLSVSECNYRMVIV